jgi:glucosamine--fructose-6-phosphate aminotransferase (isomerizing)
MSAERKYSHIMLKEIHEQPQALRDTLVQEGGKIADLAGELRSRRIRFIIVAARGTSDNAAVYARYLFGAVNGQVVAPAAPSIFTVYDGQMNLEDALVLGISQSGKATDVIEVLDRARDLGAMTVALTNQDHSPILQAAEYSLLTHAHEEKSVAATKTFTTALGVLYLLSAHWAGRPDLVDAIQTVPDIMEQTFDIEPWMASRAERYRYMEACTVLARGVNFATALEMGLKLAECCYVKPQPFSAADYMHGPIAALEPGWPVIMIAPSGPSIGSMLETAQAVKDRKAEMIVFSDDDDALSLATVPMKLPDLGKSYWSPLVTAVAGQLFTYYVALHKGLDPDRPRGLTKVTLTY